MSKVVYNGRDFRIERKTHHDRLSIFDDEGYEHLTNIAPAMLRMYQKAVELSDKPDLKIVIDFAPYAVDKHTLRNNKLYHSLWIKPPYEHKDLRAFWEYLDILKRHPSALNN